MDGPTVGELIAAGLVPSQYTHPIRVTFEYSSGATLVLEDEILVAWWREHLSAMALVSQIKSTPDPYSMSSVRKTLNKQEPFRKPKIEESE